LCFFSQSREVVRQQNVMAIPEFANRPLQSKSGYLPQLV
jgi:hypothetical protein